MKYDLNNIMSLVNNGTFCPYAFNTYELGPRGNQRFCCVWKEESLVDDKGFGLTVSNSMIQDAWNCTQLNSIRRDMLDGKYIKGCERCYHEEKSSSASLRLQESNRILEEQEDNERLIDTVNEFARTGRVNEITRMDLRFSSLCNLACVMCTPDISTTSAREARKILDKDSRFGAFTNYIPEYEHETDFGLVPSYMSDVQSNIHNVRKLFFIGGEPSVMRSIPLLLEYCIEEDIAKNIEVQFSINVTNLAQKSIDLLKHFKTVQITLSIDGVGKVNEYIRYPSNWNKLRENLDKLLQLPEPFWFSTAPVPQVYNILHWYDLMVFWDEINSNLPFGRQVFVGPCDLVDPEFLKFQNLPLELRSQGIKSLNKCFDLDMFKDNDIVADKTRYLISELEDKSTFEPHIHNSLVQYTKILDEQRGITLEEYIPEIASIKL